LRNSQIVEIVFTGLYFHTTADVNGLHDRVEARIQETGEPHVLDGEYAFGSGTVPRGLPPAAAWT
jgi:hypothetical protein